MNAATLIRELDRLYLAAQRSGDPDDWTAYAVMKATVDRLLHSGPMIVAQGAPERANESEPIAIPNAPQRGLKMRLRAFLHAVAIRFRSRVGLPLAGSGS